MDQIRRWDPPPWQDRADAFEGAARSQEQGVPTVAGGAPHAWFAGQAGPQSEFNEWDVLEPGGVWTARELADRAGGCDGGFRGLPLRLRGIAPRTCGEDVGAG